MSLNQIDCFKMNMFILMIIGVWPGKFNTQFYKYYSKIVVTFFVVIYNSLFTINFYFVEKNLDSVVEEMIFYFTEIACTCKVFTFLLLHEDIVKMLAILESDTFQPVTDSGINIIRNAKNLNVKYWKIVAAVSITSNLVHMITPVLAHIFLAANLKMPICSYSFLSEAFKETYTYILYLYQCMGIHITMLFNVNIDTFILGVMILTIAQMDILDEKLRNICKTNAETKNSNDVKERQFIAKFKECIIHYDEVSKLCALFQRIFSITLFAQFSMSSYIICICLFRFTLPAPWQYFVFLVTYMTVMMLQVMVPCWYGSQIIEKSINLSRAVYACNWTSRSRCFRTNMCFFTARAMQPLTIIGWKMFPLSLKTFTAIMNSAYSAFALLRHMQTR